MNVIYLLLACIIGFFIGIFFFALCCNSLIFGTLKTAYDDDGPYLFLDMDKRPEDIQKRSYVIFKVDHGDLLSQK